jgi:hypothetical protein
MTPTRFQMAAISTNVDRFSKVIAQFLVPNLLKKNQNICGPYCQDTSCKKSIHTVEI